ncbi:mRNA decay activator protein ZFP36L1-like isoform X1 [Pelobates fuscus]|uniref:mRNA decay activator protein ZFP36L1-like isoform X1 n=2 Tax=Pelobates fuscus TaxID=191477 RepID=UPI002FE4DA05
MSELFPTAIADLSDVLCQSNKMNHIITDTPAAIEPLMDRKAVGTPAVGRIARRHSVGFPSHKFSPNQLVDLSAGIIGNKENKFRDRSFSDSGERVTQKPSGSVNSSRYKTELCRPFEENGSCKYGEKCQFAHGMHELRSLTRHHKYKTELCRTYHTIGFCPYGPRCHFIHNAEERRLVGACDKAPLSPPTYNLGRPKFQHSFSFAGFPSTSGLLDSPNCSTTPLFFGTDDVVSSPTLPDYASSPFTSQEIPVLFAPTMGIQIPLCSIITPESPTFLQEPMSETPHESEVNHQDSLSDQEGYVSSCSSGSDSPSTDASKRLPIFSRLSVSDDI